MIRRHPAREAERRPGARANKVPPPTKPARTDKPEMTLDRALSRAGIASRTEAARLIAAGRVTVDARPVRDPQTWVAPAHQRLALDGHPLVRPHPLYFALHKPVGFITSHGDPEGRPTIYDLLGERASRRSAGLGHGGFRVGASSSGTRAAGALDPAPIKWLFPVGRLDRDTSGLLLLTNDSVFAERIANPTLKVGKTYRVKVQPPLRDPQIARLRSGLDIGRGERAAPARVTWLRGNERFCWIEMEIHEGKNRQVRRMIEALGHRVQQLVRVRIGALELGTLRPGALRPIRPVDVFGPGPSSTTL